MNKKETLAIPPVDDHEMDVDTPSSDEQERNVATPPIYEQEVTDVVTQEPTPELSEFPVCEDGAATPPIGEQVMTDVVTQEPVSEQAIPENPIFEDTTTTPPVCEQEMTDVVTQEPTSEHVAPKNPEPELGAAIPGEVRVKQEPGIEAAGNEAQNEVPPRGWAEGIPVKQEFVKFCARRRTPIQDRYRTTFRESLQLRIENAKLKKQVLHLKKRARRYKIIAKEAVRRNVKETISAATQTVDTPTVSTATQTVDTPRVTTTTQTELVLHTVATQTEPILHTSTVPTTTQTEPILHTSTVTTSTQDEPMTYTTEAQVVLLKVEIQKWKKIVA
jgi:hypothetical protein